MNRVILMGRLARDPEVTIIKDKDMHVARYTLAVDRRFAKKDAEVTADFIRCVVFGKGAEFAEKYFKKGQRVLVEGRIQTGSYVDKTTNKTVYTTDVILDSQEFADSKQNGGGSSQSNDSVMDGFMDIPQGVEDDELPFS